MTQVKIAIRIDSTKQPNPATGILKISYAIRYISCANQYLIPIPNLMKRKNKEIFVKIIYQLVNEMKGN